MNSINDFLLLMAMMIWMILLMVMIISTVMMTISMVMMMIKLDLDRCSTRPVIGSLLPVCRHSHLPNNISLWRCWWWWWWWWCHSHLLHCSTYLWWWWWCWGGSKVGLKVFLPCNAMVLLAPYVNNIHMIPMYISNDFQQCQWSVDFLKKYF